LVHASLADLGPEERQLQIELEVKSSLKQLSPSKRRAALENLAKAMAPWSNQIPARIVRQEPTLDDFAPEDMAGHLAAHFAELEPERQEAVRKALTEAGVVEPSGFQIPPEILQRMGLQEGNLDAERLIRALGILTEVMLALDKALPPIWWKILPGKAMVNKELRQMLTSYIAGDERITHVQIREAIDRERRLIAALLGAIPNAIRKSTDDLFTIFNPDTIEDSVGSAGFMKNRGEQCWLKYRELAEEHFRDADALEHMLLGKFGSTAENFFNARNAPTGPG
jgi:hypothetical protein